MLAFEIPPGFVPPENPATEEKRILGKILFWDEQLSSDNTIACGTCHIPAFAGSDPRFAVHPGHDLEFDTDDDIVGSFGVIRADSGGDYQPHDIFEFQRQVTERAAQPNFLVSHETHLFWDGRAGQQFIDPQTGEVVITQFGALESQAVVPITSSVEMATEGREWTDVISKLESARPLALARDLPPDMADAIARFPSYPELFAHAFGDSEINARRIAFAMATYQRSLVPDQSPWDRWEEGDEDALTEEQKRGKDAFFGTTCGNCHIPPIFSRHSFTNIGVRPWEEDPGRMNVTQDFEDRGKFKVPTLRNVGLKPHFMHNGQITTLREVVNFYRFEDRQFHENIDGRVLNVRMHHSDVVAVVDFMANGLLDPRVPNEEFPFDRPKLHSESETPNPRLTGSGLPGSGGFVPQMIAVVPPNIGNTSFKIGVHDALGGAEAFVAMSSSPPFNGILDPDRLFGPIQLAGQGAGEGYATWHWNIPDDLDLKGRVLYLQWFVTDPNAPNGRALSPVAELTFFCHNCPDPSVSLDGFRFVHGARESGGLDDLTVSDDSYLKGRSQPWFEVSEPNILEIIVDATSQVASPSAIDLLVEARLDTSGGDGRIRLRNWNTGELDEVHRYPIGHDEEVVSVTAIDAAPYVRSSDRRIELSYKNVVVASFLIGFRTEIDHIEITARE